MSAITKSPFTTGERRLKRHLKKLQWLEHTLSLHHYRWETWKSNLPTIIDTLISTCTCIYLCGFYREATVNCMIWMHIYVMDQCETWPASKLSNGFKAAQTVLKSAGLFWTSQANANGFKAVQGFPCLLLDHFIAIYSWRHEPDCFKMSVCRSLTAFLKPFLLIALSMASLLAVALKASCFVSTNRTALKSGLPSNPDCPFKAILACCSTPDGVLARCRVASMASLLTVMLLRWHSCALQSIWKLYHMESKALRYIGISKYHDILPVTIL